MARLAEDTTQYHYTYIVPATYGEGFSVKGVGTHEASSVLAGQDKIVFIDAFDTVEEAQELYPYATASHPMLEPQNTYDHLEGEEL